MVQMEMQSGGLKKLDECEAYKEALGIWNHRDADSEFRKVRREVEKSDTADPDYKNFLLYILANRGSVVQGKRRRGNDYDCQLSDDCHGEEVNDPQYEQFLKCLTEHEKSYVLKYEKNGVPVVVKYEEKLHLDEDCDPQPRRKLRSAVKQQNGPSNQMPGVGNQCERISESTETKALTRRILRSNAKTDDRENTKYTSNGRVPTSCQTAKVKPEGNESLFKTHEPDRRTRLRSGMKQISLDNQCKRDLLSMNETQNLTGRKSIIKATCEMVPDSDYLHFLEKFDVEGDNYVYTYNGLSIIYENNDVEHNKVDCNRDDASLSDVDIIDKASFNNALNRHSSRAISTEGINDASGFREQLIKVLKKSYDNEEYKKLWRDIELHKPQEDHRDMRNLDGRERPCSKTTIDGKSYLDHFPDLNRKLLRYKHDKPKCLNLLRGFFFWLQNGAPFTKEEGSFLPWKDKECLAIKPSCC